MVWRMRRTGTALLRSSAARWLLGCVVGWATILAPCAAQAGVGEKAAEAKEVTVQAARKTGTAVKEAASAVGHAARHVAGEVADGAKQAWQEGGRTAKKVAGEVADGTRAAAARVKEAASR